MGRKVLFLTFLLFLSSAMSYGSANFVKDSFHKMVPDDDDAFARNYIELIRNGDYETAIRELNSDFVKPGIEEEFTKLTSFFGDGDPVSIENIGFEFTIISGKKQSRLTYQYQFSDSWLVATVVIETIGGKKQVYGVHITPLAQSLEEINAFTLTGKSFLHYSMFTMLIAVPIFSLFVLIVCIRTKMRRLKWLWIIFIILGLGKLGLNWSSGQILFNPLSFNLQLLGASFFKNGLYDPWIISISIPLGAILFMVFRKKLLVEAIVSKPLVCEDESLTDQR